MYSVKQETEEILCHGCLSADRRLSPLTDYDLYSTLLGTYQPQKEYKYLSILLCWECLALLRRTQAFRRRLQTSQHALSRAYKKMSIKTLSTLTFSHKQNFDCIIEETVASKADFPYNVDIVDVKGDIVDVKDDIADVKNEQYLESFETDYCNEDMNDDFIEGKKNEKGKAKKKYTKKEEKRAQKIDNMIDMSDPDKYFNKLCLSEREVEEILERERGDGEIRPYQCGSCGFRFFSKTKLYIHKKNNHKMQKTSSKCQHCSFSYRSQWDLQLHWWRSHPVNRCSFCGQLILRDWERKLHLERHRFRLRCTKCDMEFDNYHLYQYHDKQLHSKYICDHCGRNNASKTSLLKHIVRQHLPNKCPECPLVFDCFQRLSRHLRASHASGEQAYCVECDATFPNNAKYKRHLSQSRKHRPPKRISVPCPECGKIFSRKNYMNNHMKLFHSNESRHYCQLCNKYFVTGFSLRCHNKYVHEKIPMPKNKLCKVCGRAFATNRVLENHMRTHTGERPFACAHCSAAFAQRVALKAHLAAIHKEKLTRDGAVTLPS